MQLRPTGGARAEAFTPVVTAGLIQTLETLGDRIQPEHEVLVATAQALAAAVDADPGNAALWREFRAAVSTLYQVTGDGGSGDEFASIFERIRVPGMRSKVGDSEDA